jgi:hypothetical protein
LSLQLLPFGKSDDDFGELTFEVGLFSVLSVRRRWSARSQFVRRSSCSCFVSFCSGFVLGFRCSRFVDGPSFSSGRRGPRVRSARSSRTVRFSRVSSGGSVRFNGWSAAQAGQFVEKVRTVRGTQPDGPCGHRGQSALPGRMVRQRLAALLLGWIPPFLSRASACASSNRS